MDKKWYTSKTLWVNAIGLVGFGLQAKFGFIMSPTIQANALLVINGVLRMVTKSNITW